jgi:hypothetical protein
MGVLFANPLRFPELVNTIVVAGISAGPFGDVKCKFELTDPEGRPYKWDVKDAPGTQGATITFRGSRPSKFKLKFTFGVGEPADQADAMDLFDSTLAPLFFLDSTKKTPKPLDVLQVLLAATDIFALVAENIGGYEHEGGGLYSYSVPCLEYAPAKKKNATHTPNSTVTSASASRKASAPTFQDQQDKEIASLQAQAFQP